MSQAHINIASVQDGVPMAGYASRHITDQYSLSVPTGYKQSVQVCMRPVFVARFCHFLTPVAAIRVTHRPRTGVADAHFG
jgi:hypothetical protein